jgi:hypothetical protein
MNSFAVRFLIGQILLGGGLAFGQTWVTEPNRPLAGPEQTQGVAAVPEAALKARGVAEVTYANGLLRVAADNSSLDEILRSIARETGMKITGGVKDESVYGTYGPSTAGRVLASLLDGTGSNMLFRESSLNGPAELILTPRMGGPTPPEKPAPAPAVSSVVSAPPPPHAWIPPLPPNPRGDAPSTQVDPNLTPQQQNLQLMQQELQQQLQRQPQHGTPH